MEKSDSLNAIIAQAKKRYYIPDSYPGTIIRHGQRVIDWFAYHDVRWNAARFRQMFFDMGVAKMGFKPFVEKIVPVIYTDAEFERLLEIMGYDVYDTEEEEPIRVLVCGDRNWNNRSFMLKMLRQLPAGSTIIEGAAKGADSMAAEIGESLGYDIEEYAAEWHLHGRAAGPIRNQQMLDEGAPDVVIAFHEDIHSSKGTKDMCLRAKKEGIPLKILSGKKAVDITEWIEEVLGDAEED